MLTHEMTAARKKKGNAFLVFVLSYWMKGFGQTICPALFIKVEASFDQGLIPEQLLVSLNLFKSKICFGKRFGIGCQKEAAKAMFWKIKGQVRKVKEFWARLHHLSPCWGYIVDHSL